MDLRELRRLRRELGERCTALDPDAVPLAEIVPLWTELDRIARLAAGAKLRLTRRLEDAAVASSAGVRSTAEWIARTSGTGVGAARDLLDASRKLAGLPGTDKAVADGTLSEAQAKPIADAAASDPGAEADLLGAAQREGLRDLKDRCGTTKANADADAAARRDRIRRGRFLRSWSDTDGAAHLHLRHEPEVVAEIKSLLAPFTHARFEAGRAAGEVDLEEAYAADAVLDLARAAHATSGLPGGASRAATTVFVHIDHETLRQRRARPGATSRIAGVGPVDPAWVASVLGDAFLVLLVEDGEDVRTVAHGGRQVTAKQRSALTARGYRCSVPGCGASAFLEIHHNAPGGWVGTRVTTLDDLGWLCPHHHDQATHRGYRLAGRHPRWTWHPPPAAAGGHDPPRAA